MAEIIDLPVKACHGAEGMCQTSYTLVEWKLLESVGDKGREEVRVCRICRELLFLDVKGLEGLNLSVPRSQFHELHPTSERLREGDVYEIKG